MLLHYIDVAIRRLGFSVGWRFSGLYDWPEHQHETLTSDLIHNPHSHSHLPWLVGRDHNEIWLNYKKKGGPDKSQSTLDIFRKTFSDCGLHDLGYDYTWWNYWDDDRSVEERLDRYCASVEWSLLFPMAKNVHVDAKLSDHLLIIFNLRSKRARSRRVKRSFKFENIWALDKDCEDVIKLAWKVDITTSNIRMVEGNLD